MRKSLLIGGGAIAAIAIVITAIVLSGVVEQEEKLVLSNYPKLFEKDVVIVIGENATQMEYESAEAIAANLENLTGNKPKVYISEKTESLKYSYNLIILGTPNSNKVLKEVYKMANVTRVTDEYPGEGKGILEILRNPWDEGKAMLLVEGSDERGVKAGSEMLKQYQDLDKTNSVVKWKRNDTKIEDGRVVKVPKTVDSDGNRIADDLEKKLKNSTYRRIDDDLADVIISLNHAPGALDEIQIEKFGGRVYEKWDELVYALHASLPASNITIYMSQHPNVVLIEENSEMYANSGDKIQRNVSLEMIDIKEEMKK